MKSSHQHNRGQESSNQLKASPEDVASKAGPLTRSRSKQLISTEGISYLDDQEVPLSGPSLDVKGHLHQEIGTRSSSNEFITGLALGSPGKSPLPQLPPNDHHVDDSPPNFGAFSHFNPLKDPTCCLGTVPETAFEEDAGKAKGSRWRSIGNIFGRKDFSSRAPAVPPFHQLDRPPESASARQQVDDGAWEANALRRKRADSSRSKSGTDSTQSTTKGGSRALLRRNSSRGRGLRRRKIGDGGPSLGGLHGTLEPQTSTNSTEYLQPSTATPHVSRVPLLQVEIPNVELRFSVMFGDVFDLNTHSKRKPQPLPLLLKEDHVDKQILGIDKNDGPWSLADGLSKRCHTRDESISNKSSKIPSFSLFPSSTLEPYQSVDNPATKLHPEPSRLARSMTAPNMPAPSDRLRHHRSTSKDRDHLDVFIQNSAGLQPAEKSYNNTSGDDGLVASESRSQLQGTKPRKPPCREIKKTSSNSTFPTRKSSIRNILKPTEEGPVACPSTNESIGTGTEISIARQISISRRERQLLVPVARKLARQPMQPILVNEVDAPAARKSHHLTPEEA